MYHFDREVSNAIQTDSNSAYSHSEIMVLFNQFMKETLFEFFRFRPQR